MTTGTAGGACFGLALLGVVVPVFPGLPFAILGALCWANASRRVHRQLATVPLLAPAMGHWQRARQRPAATQAAVAGWLMVLGLVGTLQVGWQAWRRRSQATSGR